ncbi:MAG: HNH endonuclease [Actinomycetota bacterium]
MRRSQFAELAATLVGDALSLDESAAGWPARATLHTVDGDLAVDLFVGPIGLAHRPAREGIERRFQNPGRGHPITVTPGRAPLLLGIWSEDPRVAVERPVFVLADPWKRVGLVTRFSVFQRLVSLQLAAAEGWAEEGNSGERMLYFEPSLLPVAAMAIADEVPVAARDVRLAIEAAELLEGPGDPVSAERARRSVSALVRDAKFSKAVISAYGRRCAMCDLGLGLVQGAHIYPASAPGSPDTVPNGLCLCANHHLAFDRHFVRVDPDDYELVIHPDVLADASDPSTAAFLSATSATLRLPADDAHAPLPGMFHARYQHFVDEYKWAQ